MALRNYSVLANPQGLTASVGTTDVTLAVAATANYPTAPFIATIERGAANEEVVLVTAKPSGTSLTVTRGYDGSTAKTHALGTVVEHAVSAIDYREANAHVNAVAPHLLYATSGTMPVAPQQRGQWLYQTDTDLMFAWTGAAWAILPGQLLPPGIALLGSDTSVSDAGTERDGGLSLTFTMPTLIGGRAVEIVAGGKAIRGKGGNLHDWMRVKLTKTSNAELNSVQVIRHDTGSSVDERNAGWFFTTLVTNSDFAAGSTTVKIRLLCENGDMGLSAQSYLYAKVI